MQTTVLDSENRAVSGGFTPAQYELINMISCLRRDEDVAALKSVLVKFLAWESFVAGEYDLCVTTEILAEYEEILGRIISPVVAKHKKGVYVFELKVGAPVDKAFAQIRAKGYADPYVASGKPIWLIGLSFDRDTRKLVDYAAEPFGR